ncbi:MAG: dihydrodipicolinate synthase family protein [Chloroflexi bacterium]|nr:dihydrodipicolinate synthase family protein [Chloroflexota bacterium]
MQKFQGAWPAMITPYTADNQVDFGAIDVLVDYLLDKRVGGFYLCGSTGQGIFQSVAERKLVTQTALRRINGRVPAIVHVGSQALGDAIELAVHAQKVGASGVSSIIPAGYGDMAAIMRYYAAVAGAVPTLPFLPYLFSSTLDSFALVQSLGDIPNLAGTKYTGPNMYEFKRVVESRQGSWSVFSGMDEQCIFAAMFGSCGNIGSTLNIMPGIYRQIHERYRKGDLLAARDLQAKANKVTETLDAFGFMGALYSALGMLGVECGGPRLPERPLASGSKESLAAALKAVDFFEIASI